MMRLGKYLIFLVIISAMGSCSVRKPASSVSVSNALAGSYIEGYKDIAISEMRRTGIPASITLAQGIIESDYGRSRLAVEANNHFGIKCHSNWTGATIKHHDDKRNECFRKYRKAEESYYDHSEFLTSASRYSFLFNLDKRDYKGWARGLKKAGYATNPDYANMLIRTIEENELWKYDSGKTTIASVQEKSTKPAADTESVVSVTSQQQISDNFVIPGRVSRIKENNRIQFIIADENDTRESVENEFKLLRWELPKYNEIDNDFTIVKGQIIYLQPKRDKAEPGKETHTVTDGDTMYAISQKYGVKVRKIYDYNRMEEGSEPNAGEKIWLRGMKPVN